MAVVQSMSRCGPEDADVDRRGLAEVEHLVDDVGWLKEELHAGKRGGNRRRRSAMCSAVGVCFFFSEMRISPSIGSDGRRVAQRDVDAAVGQPDVVQHHIDLIVADDLANLVLDAGEVLLRLLELGARRGPDMQRICPASTCGKKSIPSCGNRNRLKRPASARKSRPSAPARCTAQAR